MTLQAYDSAADPVLLVVCCQALFTLYGYHFPVLMTFLQMLFIAPVCYIVARPSLQWDTAKGIMPLAFVNVLNVVAGLLGMLPFCAGCTLCPGLCIRGGSL